MAPAAVIVAVETTAAPVMGAVNPAADTAAVPAAAAPDDSLADPVAPNMADAATAAPAVSVSNPAAVILAVALTEASPARDAAAAHRTLDLRGRVRTTGRRNTALRGTGQPISCAVTVNA
jgi:hypothetical protein